MTAKTQGRGMALLVTLSTIILLILVSCGPGEQVPASGRESTVQTQPGSPEAAAQSSFEAWAQRAGVPYQNVQYEVRGNDGTFAKVHIVAQFRTDADAPWREQESEIECRNVGGEWQCDQTMSFVLTRVETTREAERLQATATTEAIGLYETSWNPAEIALAGQYAYVIAAGDGLHILDVSDPAHPVEVGSYDIKAVDVAVAGNYTYLCESKASVYIVERRLHIISITDPTHPTEVSVYEASCSLLTVEKNYVHLPGHIIDISDPLNPSEIGSYRVWQPYDMVVSGNHAYIADYGAGLRIVDVSDPRSPVEVSLFKEIEWPTRITAAENYVYVSSGASLHIVDVSNPASPAQAGVFYGTYRNMLMGKAAVAGNYAYITGSGQEKMDQFSFLLILDVSDPGHPVEVYNNKISGAGDIAIAGRYAYIAVTDGLRVLDISDPAHPKPPSP